MKHTNHSMPAAAATLLALLLTGVVASVAAQTPKPAAAKMPEHQGGMNDMQGMKGMNGMMSGPHHALAMAYRDNLVTFAKALRSDVTTSKAVNLDVARPAVAEMRRSFDQMKQHHQAHVATMGDHMDSSMTAMKQHAESHMLALSEHLVALDAEVNGPSPDGKKVSAHVTEILSECAAMSTMPGKAMSGKAMSGKAMPKHPK